MHPVFHLCDAIIVGAVLRAIGPHDRPVDERD